MAISRYGVFGEVQYRLEVREGGEMWTVVWDTNRGFTKPTPFGRGVVNELFAYDRITLRLL